MSKVKFKIVENTKVGTHSFYAAPVVNGTLTFDELAEEACSGLSVEPEIMKAAVSAYMKAAARNILKGFRVPLGQNFLFLYPNLKANAKDDLNADGSVKKAATADDVKVSKGISRVGCMVSPKFSEQFRTNVSWTRVDPETGETVDPDEDVTDSGSTSGTGTSSGSGSDTSGDLEP